jgi:hypothetical protein
MKKLKQCRAGFWTEATALGSMARYGGQAGLDGQARTNALWSGHHTLGTGAGAACNDALVVEVGFGRRCELQRGEGIMPGNLSKVGTHQGGAAPARQQNGGGAAASSWQ